MKNKEKIKSKKTNKILALPLGNKYPEPPLCSHIELVYRINQDGTYHILKNRYGIQGNNITAIELIALLTNIINKT